MPTYSYSCSECDYSNEIFHKTILRGQNIIVCPNCGKESFHKCIGTGKMFVWGGFKGQDFIDKGIT